MTRETRDLLTRRFGTEARAFARSPLHRDPGRLARLVTFAEPRAGEEVLDVACGPGIVAAAFVRGGARVTGLDLTLPMLREAAGSGARLLLGEAERLPFGGARFDLVVCRNTFHHLPEPGPVVREMARVLAPGGRVVIEDMRAAEDLRERDAQETVERLRDPAHARTLPRSELLALLADAGLRAAGEESFDLTVDFEEWAARGGAAQERRARARRLMEARLDAGEGEVRVFLSDGRLMFRRPSLLVKAVAA